VSLYLLDKTKYFQPKFEVKIEFSQRVLNLIGRSAHREHLINDHRTLDFMISHQPGQRYRWISVGALQ